MSFRDTKTLDRPTAILLSSLSISVNSAVRMVWRRSYSGGDVLEDIGGRVMTADGAAANNRPRGLIADLRRRLSEAEACLGRLREEVGLCLGRLREEVGFVDASVDEVQR